MPKSNPPKSRPFVSVITPTFNRRPFFQTMLQCFCNQTYPRDRMEWIIADDGTDPIEDLVQAAQASGGSSLACIRYFRLPNRMRLGAKRNFCHDQSKGQFLVYMDDDDYYPPERVEHAVTTLQKNPNALVAGASEVYVWFSGSRGGNRGVAPEPGFPRMQQFGPYGPNHATAGTFAFRRELLSKTRYEDDAVMAEEEAFLKHYTIPMVQLDPLKTILVFAHSHNTVDKHMFIRGIPDGHPTCKKSEKTVRQFIRGSFEEPIYTFFMQDLEPKLAAYPAGRPAMKPEALAESARRTAVRELVSAPAAQTQQRIELTGEMAAKLIQDQARELQSLRARIAQLEQELAAARGCAAAGAVSPSSSGAASPVAIPAESVCIQDKTRPEVNIRA